MADTSSSALVVEPPLAPALSALPSTISSPSPPTKQQPKPRKNGNDPALRQGKWSLQEEEYVHCLIDEFKTGMMPLAEGTSLRTLLSKMLNCHPMRISKKFVGSNYNGKQVYARRTGKDRLSNDQVRARRAKLCSLERKFLAKIQGKTGADATPTASSAMSPLAPSTNSLQQMPLPAGNGAVMSQVSASGVELRNLINQATTQSHADLPRNISLLGMPSQNNNGGNSKNLASNQSLQNLFADLVNSNSSGSLNNSTSLEAFQMFMQQSSHSLSQQQSTNPHMSSLQQGANQQHSSSNHHQHKANSRAAAAGRALLQGLGGLGTVGGDQKKAASVVNPNSNKPLADFSSAELAAELQKRSSLQDLVASLKNGGDMNSMKSASLVSMQDSHASQQQNSAISNLMRNSSVDMNNLMERQGSIDSLSNLAIRQSLQSMGSLFDKMGSASDIGQVAASAASNSQNNNTTWPAAHYQQGQQQQSSTCTSDLMSSFFGSNNGVGGNGASSSAASLMQSLGSAEDLRAAIGSSGINLASLLNNDEALRQLDASAPSSLNENFPFQSPAAAAAPQGSSHSASSQRQGQSLAAATDHTTAIAQFLLQKTLLEQQQKQQQGSNSYNDQHELLRNVAAVSGGASNGADGVGGSSSMDPIMSSLLSRLQANSSSSSPQSAQQDSRKQDGNSNGSAADAASTVETLKRKFFGRASSQDDFMVAVDEQHRRNKAFR